MLRFLINGITKPHIQKKVCGHIFYERYSSQNAVSSSITVVYSNSPKRSTVYEKVGLDDCSMKMYDTNRWILKLANQKEATFPWLNNF